MATPVWKFILTDLLGNQLGELTNADSRTVGLQLCRLPTASFKIPSDHYLADYLIDPEWDGLLKCYRNNTLAFHGPMLTSQDTGDQNGDFVVGNAVGALWRLGFRLIGTSSTGWALGTASSPYDLGYIAQQMVLYGNAQGFTGISLGGFASSSNGSAGTYYMKDILTALTEISTGLNSFEFEVAPTEPTSVAQPFPQIGVFNVSPLIGGPKPNVVYEYGTTKANLAQAGIQVDRSNLCTKAWIQDPSVTDNSNALTSVDSTAEGLRGRFEALIDNGGVSFNNLRQLLVDENVLVRKQARLVLTAVPTPDAEPEPLVDYIVGDQINARVIRNGRTRLAGSIRIWGITFTIDAQNNETPTLQLIQGS